MLDGALASKWPYLMNQSLSSIGKSHYNAHYNAHGKRAATAWVIGLVLPLLPLWGSAPSRNRFPTIKALATCGCSLPFPHQRGRKGVGGGIQRKENEIACQ